MNICLPLKPFTLQLSSDLHGQLAVSQEWCDYVTYISTLHQHGIRPCIARS